MISFLHSLTHTYMITHTHTQTHTHTHIHIHTHTDYYTTTTIPYHYRRMQTLLNVTANPRTSLEILQMLKVRPIRCGVRWGRVYGNSIYHYYFCYRIHSLSYTLSHIITLSPTSKLLYTHIYMLTLSYIYTLTHELTPTLSHPHFNTVTCDKPRDIILVIDSSGSIKDTGLQNWDRMKEFCKSFVKYFSVDSGKVCTPRISIVYFFSSSSYSSSTSISTIIPISYPNFTYTHTTSSTFTSTPNTSYTPTSSSTSTPILTPTYTPTSITFSISISSFCYI